MAAAPPGLHTHPVRNEIFFTEAEYSMKELGNISPHGCMARRSTVMIKMVDTIKVDIPLRIAKK